MAAQSKTEIKGRKRFQLALSILLACYVTRGNKQALRHTCCTEYYKVDGLQIAITCNLNIASALLKVQQHVFRLLQHHAPELGTCHC